MVIGSISDLCFVCYRTKCIVYRSAAAAPACSTLSIATDSEYKSCPPFRRKISTPLSAGAVEAPSHEHRRTIVSEAAIASPCSATIIALLLHHSCSGHSQHRFSKGLRNMKQEAIGGQRNRTQTKPQPFCFIACGRLLHNRSLIKRNSHE